MRASGNNNNSGGKRVTAITLTAFQPPTCHLHSTCPDTYEWQEIVSRNVVIKSKAEKQNSEKGINLLKVTQLGMWRGQAGAQWST